MTPPVDVQLLGPVRASVDGAALALRGPRQQRLVAALALEVSRVISLDRLVDVIWPASPPATARRQVQDLASQLRGGLAAAGGPADVLRHRDGGYCLALPGAAVDVSRFRAAVSAGQALGAHAPDLAARELRAALGQWHGAAALEGLECPALDADRASLDELRLTAWEQAIELELAPAQAGRLVSELSLLTSRHPARERLARLHMHALYLAGRTADALDVFQRLRRHLDGELGVRPGPGLQEMYSAILRDDPWLSARPAAAAAAVTTGPVSAPPPRQLPPGQADFTGRAADVLWLCDALAPGGTGQAPVAVLSGPGGIGKTSLAVHAARRLSALFPGGQLFAAVGGTTPAALSGGDLLGVLLTALGTRDADLPATPGERAALLRSTLHGQRALIVLDDAAGHGQVIDCLPGSAGCAVLITSRHQLRGLPGAQHRELGPLGPAEALGLLSAVAGPHRAAAEPAAARELVRLCAGLPLAVRLSAAQLAAQPGISVTELAARMAGEHRRLDGLRTGDLSVRSSFLAGYDSLARRPGGAGLAAAFRRLCLADAPELSLAAAAALLGQPAPEAAVTLAGLVDASLVQAAPGGRYRLHDLLRIFGRERAEVTDPAAGRATALRALLSWQLRSAYHANEAISPADNHPDPHRPEPAGEPARFASRDAALAWLDTELPGLICSVSQASGAGEHEIAWRLAVVIWAAFNLRGNWASWISTCEVALRSALALRSRRGEARVRSSLGVGYLRAGRAGEAIRCLAEGLAAAEDVGQPWRATGALTCNLGVAYLETGRPAEALAMFERALRIYQDAGQEHAQCLLLVNIAEARQLLGQPAEAAARFRDCLSRPVTDDYLSGLALSGLGDLSLAQQRPAEATGYYVRALDVHRRAGDRPNELRTLDRLADALDADGQPDAAAQHRFAARLLRPELGTGPHQDR